jgi:N-acetylmuramoyl-L-alanine amidase
MLNINKTNFTYSKPLIPLDIMNVSCIIIHHIEAYTATPEEIHAWHIGFGWNGFGYNYYVRKDGTIYEGRGLNIGAQCSTMNSKSVGIALEGNYEVESVLPEAQMIALCDTINFVRKQIPNKISIEPHMKYYETACPGRFVYSALPRIRENSDAFIGIDKWVEEGLISTPHYWKKALWNNININSDYFRILAKNNAEKS